MILAIFPSSNKLEMDCFGEEMRFFSMVEERKKATAMERKKK
jgi:hypothetical protein